ncbi:MAG: EamA family transporter [Burkholderiales bacterium]
MAGFDAEAGYAILSGALASGVGHAIWYAALRDLSATRAAVVQLSVLVIAALGGVVFVSEPITLRLVIASAAILGGNRARTGQTMTQLPRVIPMLASVVMMLSAASSGVSAVVSMRISACSGAS